jgi:hypothetical protein
VFQFIEGGWIVKEQLNMPVRLANIGTCSEVTPLTLARVQVLTGLLDFTATAMARLPQ